MKKAITVIAVAVLLCFAGLGQDPPATAKALFGPIQFPRESARPASSPSPKRDASQRQVPSSHPGASTSSRPAGLRYWLELVSSDKAEVVQVTTDRVFHSGEKIRLHLQSNVSGRIVVFQVNQDGTSHVLFPDRRINGGQSHIEAGMDTVIPPENAWFRFDNHPGIEKLMVLLERDSEPQPVREKEQDDRRAVTSAQEQKQTFGEEHVNAGDLLNTERTKALLAVVNRILGSKSLIVETDQTSESPAGYVVNPNNSTPTEGTLAVEVQLKHQ